MNGYGVRGAIGVRADELLSETPIVAAAARKGFSQHMNVFHMSYIVSCEHVSYIFHRYILSYRYILSFFIFFLDMLNILGFVVLFTDPMNLDCSVMNVLGEATLLHEHLGYRRIH